MNTYELLSVVIAAVAALINLSALVFIGMQVHHLMSESRRTALAQEAESARQRKRDTIEAAITTFQQRTRLKVALPWNDRNAADVDKFLEMAEQDDAVRAAIREYLDYLELLGAGVVSGVLDVDVITRIWGGRILAVAANYAPYIERRRKELGSTTLYAELLAMAELVREASRRQASVPLPLRNHSASPSGALVR